MHSEQINELAVALVKAQGEFSAVPKTSVNPFFKSKYADLATVVETATPIVAKNGLAVSQHLAYDGEMDTLTTYLIHSSGQYISSTMRLHLTKVDAQGQGSATTYARRYAYMAVLGLVADEDDDGNKAQLKQVTNPEPIKKELISPDKLTDLRIALGKTQMKGNEITKYVKFIIDKEKPENNAEVDKLIESLKEPF